MWVYKQINNIKYVSIIYASEAAGTASIFL